MQRRDSRFETTESCEPRRYRFRSEELASGKIGKTGTGAE